MKKIILIILMFSLVGCSKKAGNMGSSLIGELPGELPGDLSSEALLTADLTEVYNEDYVHVFENIKTKEIKEVAITEKEYKALGEKNAEQPYLEGYRWLHSLGGRRIPFKEAPTLSDYQYYEKMEQTSSSTGVVIKLPNMGVKEIDKTEIENNKLTPQALESLSLDESL